MKQNLSILDRMIRVLISIVIGYLYYKRIISGYAAALMFLFVAEFVFSASSGYSPIYRLLNISSLKKNNTR